MTRHPKPAPDIKDEAQIVADVSQTVLRAKRLMQSQDMRPWQQVLVGLAVMGVGIACFTPPRSPGALAFGTLAIPAGIAAALLPFIACCKAARINQSQKPRRAILPSLATPVVVDQAALIALRSWIEALAESGRSAILIDISQSGLTAKLIAMLAETQDTLGQRCPKLLLLGVSAREFRAISRMGLVERLRVVDSLDEARAITLRSLEAHQPTV